MLIRELVMSLGVGMLLTGIMLVMLKLDRGNGFQRKLTPIRVRSNQYSRKNIREPDDQTYIWGAIDWLIPVFLFAGVVIFFIATKF